MDEKKKVFITFGILVFIVLAFAFITAAITKYTGYATIAEENYDGFAKCLTENKVKMYGAFWCGHCQNNKKMFGDSFQYIDYIECDPRGENSQTDLCLDKGITGYPTWEVNGEFYPGEMSLSELAQMTDCGLN